MQTVITAEAIKQMSDEEIAELNHQLKKKLVRNVLIFAGVKLATLAAINYMVKRATSN